MRVANAGCVTPLVRRADGTTEWVDVTGLPLGLAQELSLTYEAIAVNLTPGDVVIFTSDGLVEAMNEAGELFGFDRLEQTVAEASARTPEEMVAYLQTQVTAFAGQTEARDDLTIVVLQV